MVERRRWPCPRCGRCWEIPVGHQPRCPECAAASEFENLLSRFEATGSIDPRIIVSPGRIRGLDQILRRIVAARRCKDRAIARLCDPNGRTVLSGECHDSCWTLEIQSHLSATNPVLRAASVVPGVPMLEVADQIGMIPHVEVHRDVTFEEFPKSLYLHFQTMAGDRIAFVGEGDVDEFATATVEGFSGMGTSLQSPHQRGSLIAEGAVRELAARASNEECELYTSLIHKDPVCTFVDDQHEAFELDFGEEGEHDLWFDLLSIVDRDPSSSQDRQAERRARRVLAAVLDSFDDNGRHFARVLRIIDDLNGLIDRTRPFPEGTRRHSLHLEIQRNVLDQHQKIVAALNATKLEPLEKQLLAIQHRFWSVQCKEAEDSRRKLEAWLTDTRLNRFGIQRGIINRYRFELSTHGNFDKALEIRAAVVQRDGGICQYCGKTVQADLNLAVLGGACHIDHVVPLARGGTNDLKNLQLLCGDCNLWKGLKVESELPEDVTRNFYKNRRPPL